MFVCPVCGEDLGRDINYEGEYIVTYTACENDECDEWLIDEVGRVHQDDVKA